MKCFVSPLLLSLGLCSLAACEAGSEAAAPGDSGNEPDQQLAPPSSDPATAAGGETATVDRHASWKPPEVTGPCGEGPLSYLNDPVTRGAPDWKEGAKVPLTGRPNLYGYAPSELIPRLRQGKTYTTVYPVDVSASWMPQRLLEQVFISDTAAKDPIASLGASLNPLSRFKDFADFESWLGMHPYPDCDGGGGRSIPYPGGTRPTFPMGSTRRVEPDGATVTYSCAGCHAERLFGRSILGLQNRQSRANVGMDEARELMTALPADLMSLVLGATPGETRILKRLQEGFTYVRTRKPQLRGLDTSLAQVALSLSKRKKDPYATRDAAIARAPRAERLADNAADSKPGNWWVLKYKNRWLLDGSVVSGNPVYTNLLWNEIGRGTDLRQLEGWLDKNQPIVDDITAAVFSVEPVRMTEFFPAENIDIEAAKRGKVLFDGRCAKCHGNYDKAWELPHAASLSLGDRLATVEVRYHENTPVVDVGTDGLRNQGMESLLQLNDLSISKKSGVLIRVQKGYVPPPLVGIWARFPYFHNNSAPTLCAVLTRHEDRPQVYYGGAQNDPKVDFDETCNGYPAGESVPPTWLKDPDAKFDTKVQGLGNQGHDEGVFLENGKELFTPEQKRDIVEFLQTL
ncbi:MAG: hypothetical protein ABW252_07180 [Polyangiales bacterium]